MYRLVLILLSMPPVCPCGFCTLPPLGGFERPPWHPPPSATTVFSRDKACGRGPPQAGPQSRDRTAQEAAGSPELAWEGTGEGRVHSQAVLAQKGQQRGEGLKVVVMRPHCGTDPGDWRIDGWMWPVHQWQGCLPGWTWPMGRATTLLCEAQSQSSETGQVLGFHWHNDNTN